MHQGWKGQSKMIESEDEVEKVLLPKMSPVMSCLAAWVEQEVVVSHQGLSSIGEDEAAGAILLPQIPS